MVLQSETADEDLEHFEDIIEETDSKPSSPVEKQENNEVIEPVGDHSDSDDDSSENADDSASSYSSDEGEDLLLGESSKDAPVSRPLEVHSEPEPKVSSKKPPMPGGYNLRHRAPSYCNADRAGWWELMVLASHVHPSVATMARTLLSGANIVYNGNPLNDLSLTAFLDKFMEKKPKQATWHGGSQIEPAKQLEMDNHLIGPEILSLAEVDVNPEDLVFHKFYVNKMSTSKKPKKKKKKKAPEDEAAEDLTGMDVDDESDEEMDYPVDGGDESDNEEIENMLDSANGAVEAEGEYDYDDLDKVADEEDDDLVGDASDADTDAPSDIEGEEFDFGGEDMSEDDDDNVGVGKADDGSGDEDELPEKKRNRKSGKSKSTSPFASLEEYEHLLNDDKDEDDSNAKESKQKKRHKDQNAKGSSEKKKRKEFRDEKATKSRKRIKSSE